MGFKYIIVIIDTFTRYVELFPKQEVSAIAAADALWRHTCRFTAPLEIVTDFGSQFMNQLLTHFNAETGIKHHTTIPYSKEENGIVERANKEVNGHIRNILFDKRHFKNWSRGLLCMTKRVLNTSVKQPLGVSPNTLLFGHAFSTDPSLRTHHRVLFVILWTL
jgi:transposase InsO family protein